MLQFSSKPKKKDSSFIESKVDVNVCTRSGRVSYTPCLVNVFIYILYFHMHVHYHVFVFIYIVNNYVCTLIYPERGR